MAQWQRTIRLNPLWQQVKNGTARRQDLAHLIAGALRAIKPFGDRDIDEAKEVLADDFESMSKEPLLIPCDFDAQMGALYDWADQALDGKWNGKKVCWIDTISGGTSAVAAGERTSP